jgi:3-oxoacyl-(acyl-carrier-protein) synthase
LTTRLSASPNVKRIAWILNRKCFWRYVYISNKKCDDLIFRLKVSLAALEDSGIKYNGSRTGVYVGVGMEEQYGVASHDRDTISSYSITGCTLSINANRISFVFNLHGPSMSIDTACSSSVTAFHEACRAIRDGDCDQALVGGKGSKIFLTRSRKIIIFVIVL